MHAFDGTAAGVIHVFKSGIPLKSDGGGTGHTGLAGYAARSRIAGEMFGKDAAVVVFLFVLWRVDGETLGGMGHLLVGDSLRGKVFQGVNP